MLGWIISSIPLCLAVFATLCGLEGKMIGERARAGMAGAEVTGMHVEPLLTTPRIL